MSDSTDTAVKESFKMTKEIIENISNQTRASVEDACTAMPKATCQCGAKYEELPFRQALTYNAKEKCMQDNFYFRCENNGKLCNEIKVFSHKLSGQPYDQMVADFDGGESRVLGSLTYARP